MTGTAAGGDDGLSPMVALVPARGGSRRIPGKNVRRLGGHPLLGYTVVAAIESGVFADVIVSTDDQTTAAVARHYGAEVPFMRPAVLAGDLSPDIEWLSFSLSELRQRGREYGSFALLRPTSPLRQASTIRRAFTELKADPGADSLRAVERCRQHPGKMWTRAGDRITPLLDDQGASPPWHSTPYQALPEVWVQNASLEMARMSAYERTGTISGLAIRPFVCEGFEGFDLNDPADWWVLERLIEDGAANLPDVSRRDPWPLSDEPTRSEHAAAPRAP